MDKKFIKDLLKSLNNNQKVVAASKTRSREEILKAYNLGITNFGENYAQELINKYSIDDCFSWHFIGRLQTNKIKDIVPRATLIHGVSRKKELEEINKQAKKYNKICNILIEVNLIPNDTSHGGILKEELDEFVKVCMTYSNICLKGFMIIGPNSNNLAEIEKVFCEGEQIYLKYRELYPNICELSMGMSYDYELALKHSATLIRIGTDIFGKRNYDV